MKNAKRQYALRYIVTDVASIPVCRNGKKKEVYEIATKPGCGVVEWYSAVNNYSAPVTRDEDDKTQELCCDQDTSAIIYPKYGQEYVIAPYDDVDPAMFPKRAETDVIIISDSSGFTFWENEKGDVKFFVTYDENGLIDYYRLDNWAGTLEEGETEITFEDLMSEKAHDATDRADIKGTFEYIRKMENRD